MRYVVARHSRVSHRVGVPEHRVREGVHAGGLASSRGTADDHVRHVALLGDYLQAVQRLLISYHLGRMSVMAFSRV